DRYRPVPGRHDFGLMIRSARWRNCRSVRDWIPAEYELRGLKQHLLLRRTDLCLDDLNGEILALTGDQSRDAIVDARGSLVGIHAQHPIRLPALTQRLRADTGISIELGGHGSDSHREGNRFRSSINGSGRSWRALR